MQNTVGQQNIPQQCPPQYNTGTQQIEPVAQTLPAPQNGQNVQVPNYSGVNIQIFNPSVTPPGATAPVYNVNAPNYAQNGGCYPSGYYTNSWGQQPNQGNTGATAEANASSSSSEKKTEKREIVQLTDNYIRTLENYLNSQDKEVRLMGAKEVVARLEEDHSRKDDKALNALINKMLQDPSTPVRILAMSALNSRVVSGDELTVNLLQQMQNSQSGYGQDATQATEILLKMSGKTVEKEFEVKNNTQKTETKTTKVGK